MTDSIGRKIRLENWQGGISADLFGNCGPKRQTFFLLLDAVERHTSLEIEVLGLCEHLAQARGDPVTAMLMRLMLADEERYQGLLRRIASRLRAALNWTRSPDALPRATGPDPATAPAAYLTSLASALVDEEKLAAKALRHLAQNEKGFISGSDSVLLEMVAMDSEKHARLLQFVQRRLAARARPATHRASAT
jgi:hypothetical protein